MDDLDLKFAKLKRSVRVMRGGMTKIRSKFPAAEYDELILAMKSVEFYLGLKDINNASEEINRAKAIAAKYNV